MSIIFYSKAYIFIISFSIHSLLKAILSYGLPIWSIKKKYLKQDLQNSRNFQDKEKFLPFTQLAPVETSFSGAYGVNRIIVMPSINQGYQNIRNK